MIGQFGRIVRACIGRVVQPKFSKLQPVLANGGGNAAVEFAIIAPVLVLLLCAIIEFGLAISSYFTVQEGALAGANYASRRGWDTVAIRTAITSSSPKLSTATVTLSRYCACPSGTSLATVGVCDTDVANPGCPALCSTSTCSDTFAPRKYVSITTSIPRTRVVGRAFGLPATISSTMQAKLP